MDVSVGMQETRTNGFSDRREALQERHMRTTSATGRSLGVGIKQCSDPAEILQESSPTLPVSLFTCIPTVSRIFSV